MLVVLLESTVLEHVHALSLCWIGVQFLLSFKTQMTSTSTEDEKGSWWTDRGSKKELRKTLKIQRRWSEGMSLGIERDLLAPMENSWSLSGRESSSCKIAICLLLWFGLSSFGCWDSIYLERLLVCTTSGSSSLHKELLMKERLPKEDDRFLSSPCPLRMVIVTTQHPNRPVAHRDRMLPKLTS